jgi:hypothetical protein
MSTEGGGGDREVAERAAEQLNREYRQVARELEDVRKKGEIVGDELLALARKVDELWLRVKRAQEAALDAIVVHGLAKLTVQKVKEIEVSAVEFKPADFALRLQARFAGGAGTKQLMVEMGRRQHHLFARSPALTFLYGALGDGPAEVVPVKRRRARQADRVGDLEPTKEERCHELKGKDETAVKVEELYTVQCTGLWSRAATRPTEPSPTSSSSSTPTTSA